MRADKLLMLGVGALGLYALYRLTKASSESKPSPPGVKPTPLPVPPVDQTLPDVAGPIPPVPSNISLVKGSPLHLSPAHWYHGRLEARTINSPFSFNASKGQLSATLQNMGFENVQVFMNPTEASGDIYQAFALANPGKGTRWFRVRWPLNLEKPKPYPLRPTEMVLIWNAAAP